MQPLKNYTSKLIIRKATVADAEYISLLARITFTETFGQYFRDNQDLLDYYENTFGVSKIRMSIEKDNSIYWIAFYDDLPVGYAKIKKFSKTEFIDSDNVCQLQKIYVLKDFLSKKVGYKLQNMLLAEAISLGKKYIWLSVLDANEKAILFYKKNGFTKIGNHTFEIGQEQFNFMAMKKDL